MRGSKHKGPRARAVDSPHLRLHWRETRRGIVEGSRYRAEPSSTSLKKRRFRGSVTQFAARGHRSPGLLHRGQYGVVNQGCLVPQLWHEPLSEQRLAVGRGTAPIPARRPGRRIRLERGLDGGRDEPRGLGVNDDVPAEQDTADDLPGVRRRVLWADGDGRGTGGIGLGHTRDCTTVLAWLLDTPDLQRLLRRSSGGACPVRGSFGDICHQPFSACQWACCTALGPVTSPGMVTETLWNFEVIS
jgi:hypothetical protein